MARYLDLRALPRLLVRPRRTFEDLRSHTGALQGAVVALVLIVVAGAVDALMRWLVGSLGSGELHRLGLLGQVPSLMTVVLAFLAFLLLTALVHAFVSRWGRPARPDPGMTVGLMGYAMFPVVIIGMAMSIVMAYYGSEVDAFVEDTGDLAGDYRGLAQYRVVYYVLLLVLVLWGVRVQSKAASVANESAGGRTLGCVAAAWLVSIVLWVVLLEAWSMLARGTWLDLPWSPLA